MFIRQIKKATILAMQALAGHQRVALLVALILSFNTGMATNLGVIGTVYPIKETDLLVLIKNRLKAMQANGEIKAANEGFKKRTIAYVNEPPAVVGITHTQVSRSYLFNPSITVPHNIYDQNGNLIAKAGEKVNPLKVVHLNEALIFIDGSDKKEIAWSLKENKKWKGKTKIILVKGPVIHLMKTLHHRLYFDQYGILTSHFNIKHVPAIVYQKGLNFKINEVKL